MKLRFATLGLGILALPLLGTCSVQQPSSAASRLGTHEEGRELKKKTDPNSAKEVEAILVDDPNAWRSIWLREEAKPALALLTNERYQEATQALLGVASDSELSEALRGDFAYTAALVLIQNTKDWKGSECKFVLESLELSVLNPALSADANLRKAQIFGLCGQSEEKLQLLKNLKFTGWREEERVSELLELYRKYGPSNVLRAEAERIVGRPDSLPESATDLQARAALYLAESLLNAPELADAERLQVISLVDSVLQEFSNNNELVELTTSLLAKLSEKQSPSAVDVEQEQLCRSKTAQALNRRDKAVIQKLLDSCPVPKATTLSAVQCEILAQQAKLLVMDRKWGKAVERIQSGVERCSHSDAQARALYLGGKYAMADKRYAVATKFYLKLEAEYPEHRLADDARLGAALSYLELGSEKRFAELLSTIASDYPQGDMSIDGAFRLALRRMSLSDYDGSSRILESVLKFSEAPQFKGNAAYAGRERYYLAKCLLKAKDEDKALLHLKTVVENFPFSFYSLLAMTALAERFPIEAELLVANLRANSKQHPFTIRYPEGIASLPLLELQALVRTGDLVRAKRHLSSEASLAKVKGPDLSWLLANTFAESGISEWSYREAVSSLSAQDAFWPEDSWVSPWKLVYPRPFFDLAEVASKESRVDLALIYGIVREESAFDDAALSWVGAMGLMQLMPGTAQQYAKRLNISGTKRECIKPGSNLRLGAAVIASFSKMFTTESLLGIPAYNAGPGRVREWLKERPQMDFDLWVEQIPYTETRNYMKRVLASRAAYLWLYDEDIAKSSDYLSALMLPRRISVK